MAPGAVVVSATKGLEGDSLLRMSEVIAQELGPSHPVVVLSGPSFAAEVAQQLPTAVLAASADIAATELVQVEFRGPYFRLYGSDDVVGVEIGAALKNVIAIAAGVVEGLGLGHNALAALITRGLAEVTRLACAAGGRRETLAGLSGLGDLVLTCTGTLSRNRHVGIELARGRSLHDVLAGMKMVAEGVRTTGAALALGARYGVELPIATQMNEVLAGRSDVRSRRRRLMVRRQRSESEASYDGLPRSPPPGSLPHQQQFVDRFDEIVRRADAPERRARPVDVETIDALEEVLISADVGVAATDRIIAAVKARAPSGGELRDLVKQEIREIFGAVDRPVTAAHHPTVMLIVGVNGTGKTTTVGKLANLLKEEGRTPLICAADTFRAAAVEQLEIWATRAGVDIVRAREGSDPAAVVFDAISSGKAKGRDPILIDTAGRLHTRVNLMSELEKIRRIAAREVPGAPQEVLLVLDATVGQNGVTQAREFMSAAGVNGIVLTKLDGTAKGGVAVAIAHDLGLPIRYVGVGEGIDDLVPFDANEYVDGLFEEKW